MPSRAEDVIRRAFDASAAAAGLVLLSPLFVIAAIAIRRGSPGSVFFRQERVGRDGTPFRIVKFRTMRQDAEASGRQITVGADPRITRVGAFLRRSKLDELPQLINVVRGEMALVGPRPEVPRYVAHYDAGQRRVLDVRPGITDPASVAYRDENALLGAADDPDEVYLREVMPAKLAMNLDYLQRRTLLSDVGVILATVARLAGREPKAADSPAGS